MTKIALSVLATLALAACQPHSSAPQCTAKHGTFTSVLGDPCTSKIHMCTHGKLEGELTAQYDFTFDTLTPDGDDDTVQRYTGTSIVTLTNYKVHTKDTGVMHMSPDGSATFVTKAINVDGRGGFVASGDLDIKTGKASGEYSQITCE